MYKPYITWWGWKVFDSFISLHGEKRENLGRVFAEFFLSCSFSFSVNVFFLLYQLLVGKSFHLVLCYRMHGVFAWFLHFSDGQNVT